MTLEIKVIPYLLNFKFNARTSRGSMREHKTWFFKVWSSEDEELFGLGECAPFEGLSIDDKPDFENLMVKSLESLKGLETPKSLAEINKYIDAIDAELPAVKFGLETALRDLFFLGKRKIFDTSFYMQQEPLNINGLVWIGSKEEMLLRLNTKLKEGFSCIKLKIGSLSLADDIKLLSQARALNVNEELTLRLDANGAYSSSDIDKVLESLRTFNIHSIEQPIKPGQIDEMKRLCTRSPIPIALDEELIGINKPEDKRALLLTIMPHYIVLKPTLLGGFRATTEWIELAEELSIGWWVTSALESNIGLNAICQYVSQFNVSIPQGLGTGGLYYNNIPSPLTITGGDIGWDKEKSWDLSLFDSIAKPTS